MRVNIHIPDDLNRKLQKANLNVSSICQEALEHALRRKENLNINGSIMEQLMARMTQEKEEYSDDDYEAGRTLVKRLAKLKQLKYADFAAANKERITEKMEKYAKDEIEDINSDKDVPVDHDNFVAGVIDALKELGDELGLWK